MARSLGCRVNGAHVVAWISPHRLVFARLLLAEVKHAFEVKALKALLRIVAKYRVKTLVLLFHHILLTLLLARVPIKVV